jgi:hypothetical protein
VSLSMGDGWKRDHVGMMNLGEIVSKTTMWVGFCRCEMAVA